MPTRATQTPDLIVPQYWYRNLPLGCLILWEMMFQELIDAQVNLFEISELRNATLSQWVADRTEYVRHIIRMGNNYYSEEEQNQIMRTIRQMHASTRHCQSGLMRDARTLRRILRRRSRGRR